MYYKNKDELDAMNLFIQEVKNQLFLMTSKEKDDWIIQQAQLLPEAKHQDFLKSLSQEKIIMDMPSYDSIDAFANVLA